MCFACIEIGTGLGAFLFGLILAKFKLKKCNKKNCKCDCHNPKLDYFLSLTIRLIIIFLLLILPINHIINPITTNTSNFILSKFTETNLENNIIQIGNHNLEFVDACTATSAYILLIILILLTPKINLKKRIKILATGIISLILLNILRISFSAYLLLNFSKDTFEATHLIFWKILSTIFVAGLIILIWKIFKIKQIPVYDEYKELKSKLDS